MLFLILLSVCSMPVLSAQESHAVHAAIDRGLLYPGCARGVDSTQLVNGQTLVTHAIVAHKQYALDQLIADGADLNAPNADGKTPLELTIPCDQVLLFKKLVLGGAVVTQSIARQAAQAPHIAHYLRATLAKIVPGSCSDRCNYVGNIAPQQAVELLTAMAAGAPYLTLLIQLIREGAIVDGLVEDIPLCDCVCRANVPELMRFLCRHGISFTAVPASMRSQAPWFYEEPHNCRAGVYEEFVDRIAQHRLDAAFLRRYFTGRYPLNINRLFPSHSWADALTLAVRVNDLRAVRLLYRFGARHVQQALAEALRWADCELVEWLLTHTTARLHKVMHLERRIWANPYRTELVPYLQRLKAL